MNSAFPKYVDQEDAGRHAIVTLYMISIIPNTGHYCTEHGFDTDQGFLLLLTKRVALFPILHLIYILTLYYFFNQPTMISY